MAVYGVGAVGFALIQHNKLIGAKVVTIGGREPKLKIARELGADYVVNATKEDVVKAVEGITGGEGADVVYELVGTRETFANSVKMAARGPE